MSSPRSRCPDCKKYILSSNLARHHQRFRSCKNNAKSSSLKLCPRNCGAQLHTKRSDNLTRHYNTVYCLKNRKNLDSSTDADKVRVRQSTLQLPDDKSEQPSTADFIGVDAMNRVSEMMDLHPGTSIDSVWLAQGHDLGPTSWGPASASPQLASVFLPHPYYCESCVVPRGYSYAEIDAVKEQSSHPPCYPFDLDETFCPIPTLRASSSVNTT
jgi:hypothetical protein